MKNIIDFIKESQNLYSTSFLNEFYTLLHKWYRKEPIFKYIKKGLIKYPVDIDDKDDVDVFTEVFPEDFMKYAKQEKIKKIVDYRNTYLVVDIKDLLNSKQYSPAELCDIFDDFCIDNSEDAYSYNEGELIDLLEKHNLQ